MGSMAGGLAMHGCKPGPDAEGDVALAPADEHHFGRTPKEKELIEKINSEQFFNEHEMATMAVLCDLILPANDKYGSATDAGVPEFIEFMSKDIPQLQTPLRGGFMWLDHKSNSDYNKEFKDLEEAQQKAILDTVAYYDPEVPMGDQSLEIQFFSTMRNLTLTGYYTSKIGIEEIGYKGNTPNVWDGVPQEVLDQHGVAYDEAWISRCVDQSKRGIKAEWDEEGNLIT